MKFSVLKWIGIAALFGGMVWSFVSATDLIAPSREMPLVLRLNDVVDLDVNRMMMIVALVLVVLSGLSLRRHAQGRSGVGLSLFVVSWMTFLYFAIMAPKPV